MALRRSCIAAFLFAVAGCNGGGVLEVTANTADASAQVTGPSTNEMVSAGTVAANGKYKVIYTLGQASPNQGPATSPGYRDNGGLAGAVNGTSAKPSAKP